LHSITLNTRHSKQDPKPQSHQGKLVTQSPSGTKSGQQQSISQIYGMHITKENTLNY